MLPTKVFQLDYQDFGNLVWNDIEKIKIFAENKEIKFSAVIAKLRNGVIPGSIISNCFNIPMGVIEANRGVEPENFKLFLPSNLQENSNILLVDSISGTGKTLADLTLFLKSKLKNINVYSYVTLVDEKSKIKPDIIGTLEKKFIQPPWEWMSFTPQSHLERLESGNIKAAKETEFFIAFSSVSCRDNVESMSGKVITSSWIKVFSNFANDNNIVQATSGISSLVKDDPLSLLSYKTKFKKIIDEKVSFILSGGISHYIEDNLQEAILISQECPVTHIFYFDGKNLHKIYAKKSDFSCLF